MEVLFLTSGGPEKGMGHVYKAMTLAGYLEDGVQTAFVVTDDGPAVTLLQEHGHEPTVATARRAILDILAESSSEAVVVDHPAVSESMLREVRAATQGSKLVVVGNRLTTIPKNAGEYADVIVDFSAHLDAFASVSREENGTTYLEGVGYLVLREQFDPYEDAWEPDGELDRILILFGGSDPENHTTRAVRELTAADGSYFLDICIGPGFRHEGTLREALVGVEDGDYRLERSVDDVPQRMESADLLLTSPGLSTLEGLFVGCPVVALYQTDNHRITYENVSFTHDPAAVDSLIDLLEETYEWFRSTPPDVNPGDRRDEVVDAIID